MKNTVTKYVLLTLVPCVFGFPRPVSQPTYSTNPYLSAQVLPQVQYNKQPEATGYVPQYLRQPTNRPVYDSKAREGLQNYATQDQQTHVNAGSNVDRQVQSPLQLYDNLKPLLISQARESSPSATYQKKYVTQPQTYQTEQYQTQPQQYVVEKPTQVRYVQRPVTVPRRQQQDQGLQEEEDYDPNPSYQFGFDVKDELNTNYQNRKEQREGNKITGSYSVVDSDGFIRTVSYTADPKEGFKAEVSRQPTDIVVKVPKPLPQFQTPKQRVQYVQETAPQRNPAPDHRQPANIIYQYQ
ncbi:uncharacterized protein LOC130898906 [Diorhabda carinulata]|uniref:uncharacterized protein LOC130898906 n=1 Tax=Diorhabda carinulata TaxID=1163345 RepID=UPI0025A2A3E3|nr:uncharacterized protein LOC130898906 [Diorhabda carinulata]